MQFPVFIELRRSRLLLLLLFFFHCLALGCVFVLPWPGLIQVLLGFLVIGSAARTARPPESRALRLAEGGGIEQVLAGGVRETATVLPDSTVFSQLIVLRLQCGDAGRIVKLALLPDTMRDDEFRTLRLWLRWNLTTNEASDV